MKIILEFPSWGKFWTHNVKMLSMIFALSERECHGVSIMPDSKFWAIDTCLSWQDLHNSMVTKTDMVSTQEVGKRWRNRKTRSNFIGGQILPGFGKVILALLCVLRTWEARSPNRSVPPSAPSLLWEPYMAVISKNCSILTFDICYITVWRKCGQKCNCLYIIFKKPTGKWYYKEISLV